jgi:hypothetical protein
MHTMLNFDGIQSHGLTIGTEKFEELVRYLKEIHFFFLF